MNRIQLEAHPRIALSKGERNRLRRQGHVPGVLYGKDREPEAIYITHETFKNLKNYGNRLVDVSMENGDIVAAMVQEIDRDMLKHHPLHIDLHAVNLGEPINVEVAVILDGLEPVEKKGAVIQQQAREVVVRCLPTEVPEYILHNIAALEIGDAVHARDLSLPAGLTLQTDPDEVICSIIEAKNAAPETEIEPKEPELVHDTEGKGKEAVV